MKQQYITKDEFNNYVDENWRELDKKVNAICLIIFGMIIGMILNLILFAVFK